MEIKCFNTRKYDEMDHAELCDHILDNTVFYINREQGEGNYTIPLRKVLDHYMRENGYKPAQVPKGGG